MTTSSTTQVSRVAVLWNSVPGKDAKWGSAKAAAQVLAVKLQSVEVRASDDLDRAFAAMTREHADALLTLTDSFTTRNRKRIVDLAAKTAKALGLTIPRSILVRAD